LHPEVANAPVIRLGLALYLNAWFDLDYERDASEYEPIKRSDCFTYAADYDFDDEQREDLWYYIVRMDRAYLKYRRDTAPPPDEGKGVSAVSGTLKDLGETAFQQAGGRIAGARKQSRRRRRA
jgi:hypothetical protein